MDGEQQQQPIYSPLRLVRDFVLRDATPMYLLECGHYVKVGPCAEVGTDYRRCRDCGRQMPGSRGPGA